MEKHGRFAERFGDFAEHLVVSWLSRSGFEAVARVDYVGVDVIARHCATARRLGISVKGRARVERREATAVRIFDSDADRVNLERACGAFGCQPWLAVYVETERGGDLYFTSLDNFTLNYRSRKAATADWKMGADWRKRYAKDPNVVHMRFDFATSGAWGTALRGEPT